MRRPDTLDYRRSLRRLMEHGDPDEIEGIATRQERTVDALLQRMYDSDHGKRRELVLLADEVGLGKTFVALGVAWSVLVDRIQQGLPAKPVLIVTPGSKALFGKWQRDLETFLKEVVPASPHVVPVPVETPHGLVNAMSMRDPAIVVARMSAFEGRLHEYDVAIAATLHALFNDRKRWLNMDQRLQLVAAWPQFQSREAVDLRRSNGYWAEAEGDREFVGFGERHVKRALNRLRRVAPSVVGHIDDSFERVRSGRPPKSNFDKVIKELSRAALGQRVPGTLPLVIVDEIHNWKNHPLSWQRFLNVFGGRIERMLGLSATPFQLDPDELISLLDLRRCLHLEPDRAAELDVCVTALQRRMQQAQQAGARLAGAWSQVRAHDVAEIEAAWSIKDGLPPGLPSRIGQALQSAKAVESAHSALMENLRPFLVRHRRDTRHRRWRVGCDARAALHDRGSSSRTLTWRPGLDVDGDGELVHYLMMRAMQESKHGRGATSLGSDLGGSYDFFRGHELKRLQDQAVSAAKPYLDLVDLATGGAASEAHPKLSLTVRRAFDAWSQGEKTLVFCFNPMTVDAVRNALAARIQRYEQETLAKAFGCTEDEYAKRLENFQKRLYNYRQSLFLLFQDHPFSGPTGRVPPGLALNQVDLAQIARKLAAGGAPRDHSRFDRRRILAATEQVLVARWREEAEGVKWLERVIAGDAGERNGLLDQVLSPSWPTLRRSHVEGVQRESEAEPFQDDDDSSLSHAPAGPAHESDWRDILASRAGRAVLAPYLDEDAATPSLLTRWHARALDGLPMRHRALAARMLRRMVRSPGFLARFLLNDVADGAAMDDGGDEADGHWTTRLHDRWSTPPAGGESALQRFNAYLDTLRKVVDHETGTQAYEDAARNRDTVARVTGAVPAAERDRFFTGFNTPLVPEILIVTSVGQEGIDLHRECRHVIHHDLPWNPATLEQRTGRVDRIGSKAERLAGLDAEAGCLDVVVPYVANTYDEYRFRRVHARAHLFEVTMGANYVVDTAGRAGNDADDDPVVDDANVDDASDSVVPLPPLIAEALRMRLEAE